MKKWVFFLFLSSPLMAAPIISPSTATVTLGGTVNITSTDTITCALASGSTGTLSGCLYTAPTTSTMTAHNLIDGCMALPNDHVINTRIDSLPLDSNSATRIAGILGGTSAYIQIEVSFPHNVMYNTTPTTSMNFFVTANNNANFPTLSFPYMGVENAATPTDYFAQDRHVLGVNTDTCQFYEMYNFYPVGANGSCALCNSQSGVQYSYGSYRLPDTAGGNSGGGTDAAGMFVDPLAFRYSELKAGVIKHALRFTLANGYIQSGFVWPAVANATPGCTPSSACVPYGARFRLKSTFNISSYSPTTQVILKALQQYGMFMNDGGTTFHITSADDVFGDTTTYQAIQSEIRFGNIASQWAFEQVDESGLEVSSATAQVNLSGGEVPENYAEVIVTKTSDSSTARRRIAITPVTAGTSNVPFQASGPMLSIMAGTPQFQIPTLVGGTSNKSVTCTMVPSTGTLTSGCLFTAPATKTAVSTYTVTITPAADPNQAFSFPMTIFPNNAIRVNVGGPSAFKTSPVIPYDASGNYGPDGSGNMWWSDPTGVAAPWTKIDGGFPQSSWPSTGDPGLYYTYAVGNQDGAFSAMVPNGTYTLTLGFGVDPSNTGISSLQESVDSQGSTIFSTTTMHTVIGTTNYNPSTASTTVTVTNNQFYFAIRDIDPSNKETIINNWSLVFNQALPTPGRTITGKSVISGKCVIK